MEYKQTGIAFVDLLGFTDLVRDTDDITLKHPLINEPMAALKEVLDCKKLIEMQVPSARTFMFSDTLLIFFDPEVNDAARLIIQNIHGMVRSLVLAMSSYSDKAILCRGVITIGPIFEEDDVFFGPALLNAYERERNTILDPKIVVDLSVIDMARKFKAKGADLDCYLANDWGDIWYIDYIAADRETLNLEVFLLLDQYRISLLNTMNALISNPKPSYSSKGKWIKKKYDASWLSRSNP